MTNQSSTQTIFVTSNGVVGLAGECVCVLRMLVGGTNAKERSRQTQEECLVCASIICKWCTLLSRHELIGSAQKSWSGVFCMCFNFIYCTLVTISLLFAFHFCRKNKYIISKCSPFVEFKQLPCIRTRASKTLRCFNEMHKHMQTHTHIYKHLDLKFEFEQNHTNDTHMFDVLLVNLHVCLFNKENFVAKVLVSLLQTLTNSCIKKLKKTFFLNSRMSVCHQILLCIGRISQANWFLYIHIWSSIIDFFL